MNELRPSKEELLVAYQDKVRRYICSKVADYHAAEDLSAAVWLKICCNYDSFDLAKSSPSTWIYTITRNTVIDYYRTAKPCTELDESLATTDNTIEDVLVQKEELEELADALEQLEQRERDLIIIHYYRGDTLKEIARQMGVSYATAKNIHQKAIYKLRCFFETPKEIHHLKKISPYGESIV